MNPTHRILWIEDDYLDALAEHLTGMGYELVRAFQVSEAEERLAAEGDRIHLVLLDLMIDLDKPDLELGYSAENTGGSYRTGLEWYRRNRETLRRLGIPLLVYTILGNQHEVRDEFLRLGVPDENVLDKPRTANVSSVGDAIARVLRGQPRRSS